MKSVIHSFIQDKNLALVGASRDRKKWGNVLLRELKKKDYTVYPVNPNGGEIDGERCYRNVSELPKDAGNVIIALPPQTTGEVVRECARAGIKRVWIHKGIGGKDSGLMRTVQHCRDNGIEVVHDLCPLMFFSPTGLHKVHFWLKKLTGRLPQDL